MAAPMEETSSSQLQARFFTKQDKYAIPGTPFSLPASVQVEDLSLLINRVLKESCDDWTEVEFDFLVNGEFLRVSLQEHLTSHDVSSETVVEIEYVEKHPSPEPQDSLMHDDWVSSVHTQGDWILSGCYDNTVHIWTKKGRHLLTIPGHTGAVKSVAWVEVKDPVATFISTSQDQTAMIWQWSVKTNSVQCINVCRGHERSVDCAAVDPTATFFATGSWDYMLKIWGATPEGEGGEEERETAMKKLKTESGKSLTRTPLVTLAGHKEAVSCVQWTAADELCTGSWDHTLKLWDSELGGMKSEIAGNKSIFDISWSPLNRMIITASADRHIRLYDPRSKEGSLVKVNFTSHTGWVSSLRWSTSQENLFISGSFDNVLKLWDSRSPNAPLYDMKGHSDKILCCDWTDPAQMISGSADNTLKIFRTATQGLTAAS